MPGARRGWVLQRVSKLPHVVMVGWCKGRASGDRMEGFSSDDERRKLEGLQRDKPWDVAMWKIDREDPMLE